MPGALGSVLVVDRDSSTLGDLRPISGERTRPCALPGISCRRLIANCWKRSERRTGGSSTNRSARWWMAFFGPLVILGSVVQIGFGWRKRWRSGSVSCG